MRKNLGVWLPVGVIVVIIVVAGLMWLGSN